MTRRLMTGPLSKALEASGKGRVTWPTLTLSMGAALVMYAWDNEWSPEEVCDVLGIVGASPKIIRLIVAEAKRIDAE